MYGYDERSFGSVFLRILQKRQINKMIITTINVYICKNTRGELLLSEKKSWKKKTPFLGGRSKDGRSKEGSF